MMILLFLTRARQRASSCFSPELKLKPIMPIQSVMGMIWIFFLLTLITDSRVKAKFRLGCRIKSPWTISWEEPSSLQDRNQFYISKKASWVSGVWHTINQGWIYKNSVTHKFSRNVPRNKGSCGTKASHVRKTLRLISWIFRPSISIFPACSSTVLEYEW